MQNARRADPARAREQHGEMKTSVSEFLHGITEAGIRHISIAPRHAGTRHDGRGRLQLALSGYPCRY
jgi:hypothetical protein